MLAAFLACAPFARDAAAADGAGRLVPGDQIAVTVFGQPDLSGTFQIDGKGYIELPLVGGILVKLLTPQECEKAIAAKLAEGYLNRPVVSVRIGEVRPVYVVGDVKTPGAYPFRHGSTVLSVIAQAGGYGAEVGGTLSDFLIADERVRTLESQRRVMLVRLARLEAQRDGKTAFEVPSFPEAERDKLVEETAVNEREALRTQIAGLKEELALQAEQKPRLEDAYKAIEQQIVAEKRQSDLVQSQLKDLAELSSKGLSMRSREITLQRERSAMDSNVSRYRSELARLAVTIGELDIKINDTKNLYQRRVLGEIDDLRRKGQEIDASLPSAREMRDVRSTQVANASGAGQAAPSYRLLLRRTADNEPKVLTVTGETLLEPGDVVEVKRLRMEGVSSQTAPNPGNAMPLPAVPNSSSSNPSPKSSNGTADRGQPRSLAEGGVIGAERTR